MAVNRRSARPRFTLLLLVLTAITLLTLDARSLGPIGKARDKARDAFAPVTRAGTAVFRPVGNFFEGVLHYGDLEKENARLRLQLADRRQAQLQAADVERQLKALLDQQQLDFVGDIPTVAARVVATSPSNFQLTIEIDRGRGAGVAVGMPVVSGAGLVGRVVASSKSRATVLLMTDPASNIGVTLSGSGDTGVVGGRGADKVLGVDLIDIATTVAKDEVVVTSGLQQSIFPPGIPVGRVVDAKPLPGRLQQDVTIRPVVDMRRLTFVKVLQWSPKL